MVKMKRPVGIKCPECGSEKVWRKGTTPTRRGPRVRWLCTECAGSFYWTPPKVEKKKPVVKVKPVVKKQSVAKVADKKSVPLVDMAATE